MRRETRTGDQAPRTTPMLVLPGTLLEMATTTTPENVAIPENAAISESEVAQAESADLPGKLGGASVS